MIELTMTKVHKNSGRTKCRYCDKHLNGGDKVLKLQYGQHRETAYMICPECVPKLVGALLRFCPSS